MCDVTELGGPLAGSLPENPGDEAVLDRPNLPVLPAHLVSDRFILRRSSTHHTFPDGEVWRADRVEMFAARDALRALGVLVFSVLFAEPGDTVDITLTHPGSDVRVLRLITPDHGMRLHVRPTSYEYLPSDQDKHPWLHQFTDAWDLPGVNLTRSDGFPRMTEAEWQDRDLLIGFGGMRGTVRMGQLMLDAGRCSDPRDEYELEGEIGFRGVSPGSCELRIWLPGSIAWGSWQPEVPLT